MIFFYTKLLHSAVDAVERKLIQSNGKFSIILKCKDFKLLSLEFETVEAMNSVASSIEQLSNIGKCHFELHILT